MALIRQYHKDTDTTYVYESESYWDPEKKQSRSRRKVVGKIDPATGEIVPTGKRGRKKKESPPPAAGDIAVEYKQLLSKCEQAAAAIARKDRQIESQRSELESLKAELADLRAKNKALEGAVRKVSGIIGGLSL